MRVCRSPRIKYGYLINYNFICSQALLQSDQTASLYRTCLLRMYLFLNRTLDCSRLWYEDEWGGGGGGGVCGIQQKVCYNTCTL